ncbi:MAG: tRNA (adenosine(37)-N6)-threonylcarbamoyltransferase complex ATPase subunit type 1 TsaE [Candidatus Nealsonbacteria bacterium RBG_13_42_11]|uniref:tRNA threonylcarbamoyladenosine biosynthesis protein TsaE n=1 Tax=Candidatus Nealsonbacteria bacterium RBG_13_42_11 TaxID=1801663 RepID=A0A1G2E1E3_9BACT|nr:MAG: tRNA (adenosine(37)-N6)-threonylcarbamoyltransferase complex ATPase subunit type 1 TsaE [Candidatus Nealsonbacteria bacterium RBG_13_42_11]
MKKIAYLTRNPNQTRKLGEILAKEILKTAVLKKALVLGLEGDLGGGKTTFLQGLARGLGIKEKILSPTFVIMRRFQIKPTSSSFYHMDCYRLQNEKEALRLGLKKIFFSSRSILAVEWAERIKKILPGNTIFIKFYFIDKNKRKITIKFPRNGK